MFKPKKIFSVVRDYYGFHKLFTRNNSSNYFVSTIQDGDDEWLENAKRLHASEYISRNFVTPEDILDGKIHRKSDPHQTHAVYFVVVKKGAVVGLCRQICYKGEGLLSQSFPVLEKAPIFPRSMRRIESIPPHLVVEISALVKKRGVNGIVPFMLYSELVRHSLRERHRLWIMACDVRLYDRLKLLFGPALTRIGRKAHYQGADAIPVAIDVHEGLNYLKRAANKKMKTDVLGVRHYAARYILKESFRD